MKSETVIAIIFGVPMGVCILALLYLLFVVVPVSAHAQRKCLEQGYPKSDVTYNLDVYCMNLDGSVTVKVDKQ